MKNMRKLLIIEMKETFLKYMIGSFILIQIKIMKIYFNSKRIKI